MSGLSSRSPCSLRGTVDDRAVGVAEGDPRSHRDQLVGEEQAVLEHLLEDQDRALRLGGERQRDRGQVGRERRPGSVVDLRDRVAEIVADRQPLVGRDEQVAALDEALQSEPLELAPDHQQVGRFDVADPQLAAGRGRQRHEAADLDVVGSDLVFGAAELVAAVDDHHVGADPVDGGAHPRQQMGEVLDVRLAGRVGDDRPPRRQRRGEQRVLGPHHRRLVHEDLAGLQAARRLQLDHSAAGDRGAEVAERVEVRIEPAAADRVAARRRHPDLSEAGEERTGEQERSADPGGEALIDLVRADAGGAEAELVVAEPLDGDAELGEDRDLGLGVADPRDVAEDQILLGQQACCEDRQRRVLVAGGDDLPTEGNAALNHEVLQSLARVDDGERADDERLRPRSGLGIALRVDRLRLAPQACSRRRGVDARLRPALG